MRFLARSGSESSRLLFTSYCPWIMKVSCIRKRTAWYSMNSKQFWSKKLRNKMFWTLFFIDSSILFSERTLFFERDLTNYSRIFTSRVESRIRGVLLLKQQFWSKKLRNKMFWILFFIDSLLCRFSSQREVFSSREIWRIILVYLRVESRIRGVLLLKQQFWSKKLSNKMFWILFFIDSLILFSERSLFFERGLSYSRIFMSRIRGVLLLKNFNM